MNFFVFLPKTSKISEFRKTHFKAQFDPIQFIWKLQQFQHMRVFLHPWLSQISLANHSTQTGLHSLHQLLRVPAESSIYILFQHSAAGTLSDSLGNVCEKLRDFRDRKHHNLQDLFFFSRYLACASLIFQGFIKQQAEQTAERPCEMAGTQSERMWHLLWIKQTELTHSGLRLREALLAACQALKQ